MNSKTVIGLVGEKGGGKETVGNSILQLSKGNRFQMMVNALKKKEVFFRIRSSDILKEVLASYGIPQTRFNLQRLPEGMEDMFGDGALTNDVKQRILSSNADINIFDGVRWISDEKMIRSFVAPHKNILIYVTAPVADRYERVKMRKEKEGEFGVSLEQFLQEEKASTETMIPIIGAHADFKIENSGTIRDLEIKVRKIYESAIR